VLDRLIALHQLCRLVPLLGNHEELLLAARLDPEMAAHWLKILRAHHACPLFRNPPREARRPPPPGGRQPVASAGSEGKFRASSWRGVAKPSRVKMSRWRLVSREASTTSPSRMRRSASP